jgi:hypothetical protein
MEYHPSFVEARPRGVAKSSGSEYLVLQGPSRSTSTRFRPPSRRTDDLSKTLFFERSSPPCPLRRGCDLAVEGLAELRRRYLDVVAVLDAAGEDQFGQRVLDIFLDDPLERAGAVGRVVALVGEPVARRRQRIFTPTEFQPQRSCQVWRRSRRQPQTGRGALIRAIAGYE